MKKIEKLDSEKNKKVKNDAQKKEVKEQLLREEKFELIFIMKSLN